MRVSRVGVNRRYLQLMLMIASIETAPHLAQSAVAQQIQPTTKHKVADRPGADADVEGAAPGVMLRPSARAAALEPGMLGWLDFGAFALDINYGPQLPGPRYQIGLYSALPSRGLVFPRGRAGLGAAVQLIGSGASQWGRDLARLKLSAAGGISWGRARQWNFGLGAALSPAWQWPYEAEFFDVAGSQKRWVGILDSSARWRSGEHFELLGGTRVVIGAPRGVDTVVRGGTLIRGYVGSKLEMAVGMDARLVTELYDESKAFLRGTYVEPELSVRLASPSWTLGLWWRSTNTQILRDQNDGSWQLTEDSGPPGWTLHLGVELLGGRWSTRWSGAYRHGFTRVDESQEDFATGPTASVGSLGLGVEVTFGELRAPVLAQHNYSYFSVRYDAQDPHSPTEQIWRLLRWSEAPPAKHLWIEYAADHWSLAEIEELREAARQYVEKSGGEVYVYTDRIDLPALYLGSVASTFVVDQDARIRAIGLSRIEVDLAHFGRDVGIEVDRVVASQVMTGEYPVSETKRAMIDQWNGAIDAIARGREQDVTRVVRTLESGALSPDALVSADLADRTATFESRFSWLPHGNSVRARIVEAKHADSLLRSQGTHTHVALVDVRGDLVEGVDASAKSLGSGIVIVQRLSVVLMRLALRDDVSGIILHIDSRRGTPGAAYELHRVLTRVVKEKPVVVVFGAAGIGSAFVAAHAASRSFASASSLLGGIDVLYTGRDFSAAMEKIGVRPVLFGVGANALQQRWCRPLDASTRSQRERYLITEQTILLNMLGESDVRSPRARALSRRISGRRALASGWIDEIGGIHQATQWLLTELQLTRREIAWEMYPIEYDGLRGITSSEVISNFVGRMSSGRVSQRMQSKAAERRAGEYQLSNFVTGLSQLIPQVTGIAKACGGEATLVTSLDDFLEL